MSNILTPWHHLEELERLNRESFAQTIVDKDNLEDFRIHAVSAIIQLCAIVDDLQRKHNQ